MSMHHWIKFQECQQEYKQAKIITFRLLFYVLTATEGLPYFLTNGEYTADAPHLYSVITPINYANPHGHC